LNKLHKKSAKIALPTKIGANQNILQKPSKITSATLVHIGVSLNAIKRFAQASRWRQKQNRSKQKST
jgi:hypothetical protein